MSAQRLQILVC